MTKYIDNHSRKIEANSLLDSPIYRMYTCKSHFLYGPSYQFKQKAHRCDICANLSHTFIFIIIFAYQLCSFGIVNG